MRVQIYNKVLFRQTFLNLFVVEFLVCTFNLVCIYCVKSYKTIKTPFSGKVEFSIKKIGYMNKGPVFWMIPFVN